MSLSAELITKFIKIQMAVVLFVCFWIGNNELNGEGFLMKTRNFRGQVSQGLVLPLSILEGPLSMKVINNDYLLKQK